MSEMILATIKSGFDFGTELLKWLQTPEGQALSKKIATDAAAREKAWEEFAGWAKKFFMGELLK